mmetsp:Transcript_44933/g.140878  ORF Transcript_44933/g.140878 Transcript_44933/m.140878 type:complete len:308 (-) Transcript_44933:26-949(-)
MASPSCLAVTSKGGLEWGACASRACRIFQSTEPSERMSGTSSGHIASGLMVLVATRPRTQAAHASQLGGSPDRAPSSTLKNCAHSSTHGITWYKTCLRTGSEPPCASKSTRVARTQSTGVGNPMQQAKFAKMLTSLTSTTARLMFNPMVSSRAETATSARCTRPWWYPVSFVFAVTRTAAARVAEKASASLVELPGSKTRPAEVLVASDFARSESTRVSTVGSSGSALYSSRRRRRIRTQARRDCGSLGASTLVASGRCLRALASLTASGIPSPKTAFSRSYQCWTASWRSAPSISAVCKRGVIAAA